MMPYYTKRQRVAAISALLALATSGVDAAEELEYPVIEGSTGTIELHVDAESNTIGAIKTSGADIVLHNHANGQTTTATLQNESGMSGGTLHLSFSAVRAANTATSPLWWEGDGTETAFCGAKLRLEHVKVVLNQVDSDRASDLVLRNTAQKSGLTLYNIATAYGSSFSWNTTLEVNAPLLEKYFTNYRLGSDLFYHIDPIPLPFEPDRDVIFTQDPEQETAWEQEGWGEIGIYPFPRLGNIIVQADRELDYYGKRLRARTANGKTGMAMAGHTLGLLAPQLDANRMTMPDLAAVLDALDICVASGDSRFADRLAAAWAGACVTAPSSAAMGDLERQLRFVRNRIPSATGNGGAPPRKGHQVWLNTEADYRRLGAEDTAAGYSLNSWGGSFGLDFEPCRHVVAGISATVMYGDLKAKGPEPGAGGDLDTTYVSLYAQWTRRTWHHTLLTTAGRSDISLARTVDTGLGRYHTRGATDGRAFGILYELSKNIPLAPAGDTVLQPLAHIAYRHLSIGAYTESGSDAALRVGRSTMDTATFGIGARLQTQAGAYLLNRNATLEWRAILKSDTGDRMAAPTVAPAALPEAKGTLYGAESSATAIELGVGVSIPTGSGNGAVFFDATWETRHNDPNINTTFGYRLSF